MRQTHSKKFLNWWYFRYELMEDPNQAIEWLMQLISVVPTDSHALAKLGELYDSEGDKSQAFQYYYEVCAFTFYNRHTMQRNAC